MIEDGLEVEEFVRRLITTGEQPFWRVPVADTDLITEALGEVFRLIPILSDGYYQWAPGEIKDDIVYMRVVPIQY